MLSPTFKWWLWNWMVFIPCLSWCSICNSVCMCILLKIYCHLSFSSCSEQKCLRSKKYAAEHGLPVLKNVLLPRTKGFCACLQELRSSLTAGCPVCLYFICLYYIIIGKVCNISFIHIISPYTHPIILNHPLSPFLLIWLTGNLLYCHLSNII